MREKKNIHHRRRQSFSVVFLIPFRGHVSLVLHLSIHFTRAFEFIVLSDRVFVRFMLSKKKRRVKIRIVPVRVEVHELFRLPFAFAQDNTGDHCHQRSVNPVPMLYSPFFRLFNEPSMSHQLLLLSTNIITYY